MKGSLKVVMTLKKNPNIKLKSDYLFVVGQYYKAKMEKIY